LERGWVRGFGASWTAGRPLTRNEREEALIHTSPGTQGEV